MLQVELPHIGPYTPVRALGTGSTMLTHLYRHELRKKYAVIKVTRAPLSTLEEKESFLARAKLLKKLKHRFITEVLDAGMLQAGEPADDYGYLVTQYIEGSSIRERFPASQCAAPDEVRRVLLALADTLQYAHKMFAVHGNLHPGNVLQTDKDFFLTDFSLLLTTTPAPLQPANQAILYRAPEHLLGSPTMLSDQYSLAVMTYEWLCGQRPYQAMTLTELLAQQEHSPLTPPSSLNPAISPLVEETLLKALAFDPTQRFPQTLTFADVYLRALMGLRAIPQTVSTPVAPALPPAPPTPAPVAKATRKKATPLTKTVAPVSAVDQVVEPLALLPSAMPPAEPLKAVSPVSPVAQPTVHALPAEEPVQVSSPVKPLVIRRQAQPDEQFAQSSLIKTSPEIDKPALQREQAELQRRVDTDLRQGGVLSNSLPGYEERPAQIEMASLIARSLTQHTPAIVEASTGTGKALAVDTPIATPSGWQRMGDLASGDVVFDERGQPTRISAAFALMYDRPCYEVVFSDGSSLIADSEHEWASYTSADRARTLHRDLFSLAGSATPVAPTRTGHAQQLLSTAVPAAPTEPAHRAQTYSLVTTHQMATTLTSTTSELPNHAIALAGALRLPAVDLPLAPYLLGVRLSKEVETPTPDMGIPGMYLRASLQQRRLLLAGLLDTSGTVQADGVVEFTTTNARLSDDVYELLCSLGFSPAQSQTVIKHADADNRCRWTLSFTPGEQVFRLGQKANLLSKRMHSLRAARERFRYVVAVRPVPSRPVRCIQVEAASHLYLAGQAMIPTHNSLSYLIPVVRSNKVAIISTANKALQEQLFYKDIPFVQKYIRHFDAALVKGMGNYICLDRVEQERAGIQYYVKNADFLRLLQRLEIGDERFVGDFESLGFTLPAEIRSKVNADSDQCAWSKCSYYADCYVRKMKAKATQATVIVVNHTLLLLDALMEGYLLPERDVIVIDEAHHLEEEATRAFTLTISQAQISTLLAQRVLKDHTPPSLQEETKETMNFAWERLVQIADPGSKGRANLKEPLQEGLKLASIISKLADALRSGRPKDMPEKEDQLYDKLLARSQNLADNVRTVFSVNQAEKFVYYVERVANMGRRGPQQLEVSAAPLEITSWLKEQLFDKSNVICTSATLATIGPDPMHPEVKGPNFAYFRRRVGLDYVNYPNVEEAILPLTFDYQSHALLYLPRHLPEPAYGGGPAAQAYTRALGQEMIKLVEASRGRAFLLFSSKRMLDEVYEIFQRELPPHLKYPLLRQGDTTRMELVRSFREREGAILFGLKSFWEGVDIAGEALSLVVIDKLPFDPPDDPVHEARVAQMKAAGENWFGIYVLPQTVLRLKQGLGRLLRSHDDRGVMAILDTRLYTKSYGKQIVQAMPPARRSANFSSVVQFFNPDDDDDDASF